MVGSLVPMTMRLILRLAVSACILFSLSVSDASAEIVFLTSGRTLSVKSHRMEGESIVLTLRSGGEVTCDKSIIEKVVPDEVPHPEPVAAPLVDQDDQDSPAARSLLDSTPYGEIISALSE